MTNLTRRRFVALAGTSLAATPLFAPRAIGQAKPKLVVIGGGPGGGTVARYVNKDAAGAVEVILIEPQKNFTTCFFSNIYVGGFRDFKSITHGYEKVAKGGINVGHEAPAAIDREGKLGPPPGGVRAPYPPLGGAPGTNLLTDTLPAL